MRNVCRRENVDVEYYSVGKDFLPRNLPDKLDGWLYIVNYYGQLSNHIIKSFADKYKNIIADYAQSYFQMSPDGIDTLYTCRKFFGVADGAILYTDKFIQIPETDESFSRMGFLLGRYERSASEFYSEYAKNNDFFENQPIKMMSKLTYNLLHAIDYEKVKIRRTDNFITLHNAFENINKLTLTIPEGAFMYPLYVVNGAAVRSRLQQLKIYIPTLWADTFDVCYKDDIQCHMAQNILPLPCDQRYDRKDMEYIIELLKNEL